MRLDNLTGRQFNKLTVIRKSQSTRSGMTMWECKCECGNICYVGSKHIKSGAQKSCGCYHDSFKGNKHSRWTGVGDLSGTVWNAILQHSMMRGSVPITIDKEYAWNLFVKQNNKCNLTGLPLYLGNGYKRTASLDRIDSGQGYIPGNVQWIHKDVNRMKNVFDQDYFVSMCKLIANNK